MNQRSDTLFLALDPSGGAGLQADIEAIGQSGTRNNCMYSLTIQEFSTSIWLK